jgi:hypothetical protein
VNLWHGDPQAFQVVEDRAEAGLLQIVEPLIGLVGGGEMGVDAVESQAGQRGDPGDLPRRDRVRYPETVQSRINLDMDPGCSPSRRRGDPPPPPADRPPPG